MKYSYIICVVLAILFLTISLFSKEVIDKNLMSAISLLMAILVLAFCKRFYIDSNRMFY